MSLDSRNLLPPLGACIGRHYTSVSLPSQCTLCSVCIVFSIQCAVYTVHYALYSFQYAV